MIDFKFSIRFKPIRSKSIRFKSVGKMFIIYFIKILRIMEILRDFSDTIDKSW